MDSRGTPPRRERDGKWVLAVGRDAEGVFMLVTHSEMVRENPVMYPCWQRLPALPPGLLSMAGTEDFTLAAGLLEEE